MCRFYSQEENRERYNTNKRNIIQRSVSYSTSKLQMQTKIIQVYGPTNSHEEEEVQKLCEDIIKNLQANYKSQERNSHINRKGKCKSDKKISSTN